MACSLQIKEDAKKEIVEAAHWYAQINKGLEIRFINQLETVFNIILIIPKRTKEYISISGKQH